MLYGLTGVATTAETAADHAVAAETLCVTVTLNSSTPATAADGTTQVVSISGAISGCDEGPGDNAENAATATFTAATLPAPTLGCAQNTVLLLPDNSTVDLAWSYNNGSTGTTGYRFTPQTGNGPSRPRSNLARQPQTDRSPPTRSPPHSSQPDVCHRRLRALEQSGAISGYRAEALGLTFDALVFVTMRDADRDTVEAFEQAVATIPNVLTAQRLFGDPDYLLQVVARDLRAFQKLYDERISTLPGVQRLSSTLVMKSVVENRLPL